ncbi:zinc finger protein 660-like [Anopheles maculipalpis]|uniref:zinc finger protein 660-like n=1 Tax=Anopheles maculipalpis TaxID=1496333 RepID=UPI002159341E|nr:zinc finger protein 660-like [Anopheles maculipalpis]
MASSEMEDLMFGEICRCCMASKPRMKPLYETNLFTMLNAITGLNVHQNDGLPSQLCVPCMLQIRRSHFFKLQCETTDLTLRSYAIETTKLEPTMDEGGNIKKKADSSSKNDSQIEKVYPTTTTTNTLIRQPLSIKFFCQECSKEFETDKKLKRHIRTHYVEKPHACHVCGVAFLEKCNLNKHMLKHTGELRNSTDKPHLCCECGKSFKYSTSLSRHKRFHAQRNLFDCPICSRSYVEQSSLDVHIRTHTNERPFLCVTCNKAFSLKANLERHERTHTGEKPYSCDLCGKCFSQKSYLCIHKRIHAREKPFSCPNCSMCFVSRNALLKHQQKPCSTSAHRCNTCEKTFRYKSRLRLHRRTHHLKNVAYPCPICDRGFVQAKRLNSHIKIEHPDVPMSSEGEFLFNEGEANGTVRKTSWRRQRTKRSANSIGYDEAYTEQGEEEEQAEEELEAEEEGEEEEEEEVEMEESLSILEDYEEGEEEEIHSNEEYLVDVLSNVGSMVDQDAYEDIGTEYDDVVKEEPLLEISIMNPDEHENRQIE